MWSIAMAIRISVMAIGEIVKYFFFWKKNLPTFFANDEIAHCCSPTAVLAFHA
jgi:hypothetical protein